LLRVAEVSKSFGTTRALAGVSFEVGDGEIVGLLGPNGAGKTTLVSIICGLIPPDGGDVVIGGVDLRRDPAGARSLLGVAAQDIALVQSQSVRQNLRFFGGLAGLGRAEVNHRIDQLVADFDLGGFLDKKVLLLSGGQQRRVHIAVALVGRPKVLLLDEPTAGSDLESRDAILRRVLVERDAGATVLYTTHAMDEITELGARVVIVDNGAVIADSTVPDLLANHTQATVEVRFARPLRRKPPKTLEATVDGALVRVSTSDPATAIREVIACGGGIEVLGVDVIKPGLASAFVALTGRRFGEEENAA
jgi:ABC-2 type transport system ATP-binding protein